MQVIINLEKIVDVECLKHALELHDDYWDKRDSYILHRLNIDFETYDSIIIEEGVPTGYFFGGKFMDWDDTEAIKENSAMSNPFTNGSDCCKDWNKVKHNFIPVLWTPKQQDINMQIASILYKNDEIEILREEQSDNKDEPYIYFIDVFKHDIEDSDEAFDNDMSDNFLEIYDLLEYLENNFGISKKIIKQLENSKSYQRFLEDHKNRLDSIKEVKR
tara:strand:+ start:2320 stop:2970 length:651 start_codon:yes stop_codon:yes gene_type:complete